MTQQSPSLYSRWRSFLKLTHQIAEVSEAASKAFVRFGTRFCQMLSDQETAQWVKKGLADCRTENELVSFFSGLSAGALAYRNELARQVTLKDKSHLLSLICEAVLGHPVRIQSNISLKGVKGFTGGAATDGQTIYLPDEVSDFSLYKLMVLHQAMLIELCASADWQHLADDPDIARIHGLADERLSSRMPGLAGVMTAFDGDGLLPTAGEKIPARPWWGTLLPGLVAETETIIGNLSEMAETFTGCPQEMVGSLLAGMIAQGYRDTESLWNRLKIIFTTEDMACPEPEELPEDCRLFYYQEWDNDLSDYKKNWCKVRQQPAGEDPNPAVETLVAQRRALVGMLKRQFMRLKPQRFQKHRRQAAGDHLDMDALIESRVDSHCGIPPTENVYIRRDKRLRDVAVLFLLDTSGSTEEIVNGRRVIDIQKEAAALMAEALEILEDRYALFGFRSEGRFKVDLLAVKDFTEPYGTVQKYRLGNLEPAGFTRMGAGIRHAVNRLDSLSARVKLLIILTDGRPYDVDYGDMDYAIVDTKKAVQEACRKRVHPFIITSDKTGANYLRQISPVQRSIILPSIELLPTLLPELYRRLTI